MIDDATGNFTADDLSLLSGVAGDDGETEDTPPGETHGDATPPATGDKPAAESQDGADGAAKAKTEWPADGFPDDWRERTVKMLALEGDALKKAEDKAKRAASPAELLRSVMASDAKIKEVSEDLKGRVKIPVGQGVKPEEVQAFDKAWGVPDSPEKYDLSAAGEMGDLDKEIWDTVLPTFHKAHFSQGQLGEVAKALKLAEGIAGKRMEERAQAIDEATEEELRIEYPGKEYKANLELANRALENTLGKYIPDREERKAFLNMKFEDGTRLGSYVPLVRFAVELGRDLFADGLPEIGAGGDTGDIGKEISSIIGLAHSTKPGDQAKYQELQPRLAQLVSAQNRRNAKSSAAR